MMSLKDELQAFAKQMSKQVPTEVLETMGREIKALANSGIAENALQVGDIAPDFNLNDSDGNPVSLDELVNKGPVLISFNRGNWCPFCNIELKHLQATHASVNKAGGNLIVISPQLPEKSAQLKEEYGYNYPILHDKRNEVAKSFGIAFTLAKPLRPIHEAFQMDIPGHNGEGSFELPLAATYVIDQSKKITYAFINANWMERAQPEEYISMVNQ